MQLIVQAGNLHVVDVSGEETVGEIKKKIAALDCLPLDDVVIFCSGRPMDDEDVLGMFAANLSTLHMEVRMVGGVFSLS